MAKKQKRGLLDGYKTYNPEEEGYGSPDQWRSAFHERMGVDAARVVIGNESPLAILGLSGNPVWDIIRKAYKQLMAKWHPDRHNRSKESHDMCVKIGAAYEVLEEQYGR